MYIFLFEKCIQFNSDDFNNYSKSSDMRTMSDAINYK